MGDDGAPSGGGDPQSAAVRLLRSVAPWTAPTSEGTGRPRRRSLQRRYKADRGRPALGPTDRGQADESINGSGLRIGSFITFGFLFLVALGNSDSSLGDDGSIRVRWWAVVVALMGVWLVWTWTRRQTEAGLLGWTFQNYNGGEQPYWVIETGEGAIGNVAGQPGIGINGGLTQLAVGAEA